MISPRHILDTFKTILRPRESHKRLYLHCMMVMMLTHLVAIYAELYCQYMYTKRMFGWKVSDYSFFIMIQVSNTWNNGNRDPSWGVAEIQKMSSGSHLLSHGTSII